MPQHPLRLARSPTERRLWARITSLGKKHCEQESGREWGAVRGWDSMWIWREFLKSTRHSIIYFKPMCTCLELWMHRNSIHRGLVLISLYIIWSLVKKNISDLLNSEVPYIGHPCRVPYIRVRRRRRRGKRRRRR